MVAPASAAGGDCAPGPTPTEIYEPGDIVRWRIFGALAEALKVKYHGAEFTAGALIVTAIVRTQTLHGSAVEYQVSDGLRSWLVSPALVIRVEPPAAPAGAAVPAPAPKPTATAGEGIKWEPLPIGAGLVSADGRFTIDDQNAGGGYQVRDNWTGEERYRDLLADAKEWCEQRTDAERLDWLHSGYRAEATVCKGGKYEVAFNIHANGWTAIDGRLEPLSLLSSRTLPTEADAMRWCEIHAMCKVEPGGALRYMEQIPF